MANSNTTNTTSPNSAIMFLTLVMLLLFVAGIGFGIFAFMSGNGYFAIASTISLSSLMFGCIRILN